MALSGPPPAPPAPPPPPPLPGPDFSPLPLDADSPASVEIWDWTGTPALAGTIVLDRALPDYVYSDARVRADQGIVKIQSTNAPLIYDGFVFGAKRWAMGPQANETDPAKNLYRVNVSCQPRLSDWPGWPAKQGYNAATQSTIAKAFKAVLKSAGGATLHTWDLEAGEAINSRANPLRNATQRQQHYFTVGMELTWRSGRARLSSYLNLWSPGLASFVGSTARDMRDAASVNAPIPLIGGKDNLNSALHFWAAPDFGLPENSQALSPNGTDPFLFPDSYRPEELQKWLVIGTHYVPAQPGQHEIVHGPGGPRFTRAWTPVQYTMLATDPLFRRPKGDKPIRDLADHFSDAHFNHPYHFLRDSSASTGIPKSEMLEAAGGWAIGYSGYYGQGDNYVPGGAARHVDMFSPTSDAWGSPPDKDGRRHFNGWGKDMLHNYDHPADACLMMRSPAHAYSQRHCFDMGVMVCQSERPGTAASAVNSYSLRSMAWMWLHYANTWLVAADHPLVYTRAEIEAFFQRDLEAVYDHVYVRAVETADPAPAWQCLRNLGFLMQEQISSIDGLGAYPLSENQTLWAYMAGAVYRLKVGGLWDVMKAKSPKCLTALEWTAANLDKFCCTSVVATGGRFMPAGNYTRFTKGGLLTSRRAVPVIPASWADAAVLTPPAGSESMFRNDLGQLEERTGTMHLFAQWAFMRRDYFPEVTNPDIAAACSLWTTWYAEWRAANLGFAFGMPSNFPFRGPAR